MFLELPMQWALHSRRPARLRPSQWTIPVARGQVWNVGPAYEPARTVLDDVPSTTGLMVVAAVCLTRWWTKGYYGRSCNPQASWPGAFTGKPVHRAGP